MERRKKLNIHIILPKSRRMENQRRKKKKVKIKRKRARIMKKTSLKPWCTEFRNTLRGFSREKMTKWQKTPKKKSLNRQMGKNLSE
jgi:ribosomal protein L34E